MSDNLTDVKDVSLRLGMLLRLLRYVSPFPWGTTRAEAGRRQDSLSRTMNALWGVQRRRFLSGGGVVWTPVVLRHSGAIKFPEVELAKDIKGWLVSRQPPPISSKEADPAILDITQAFRSALLNKTALELCYDCRFLMRFEPLALPRQMLSLLEGNVHLARIVIRPETRFCLPRVIWRTGRDDDLILATMQPSGTVTFFHPTVMEKGLSIRPNFLHAQWIRTLDADVPWKGSSIQIAPLTESSSKSKLSRGKIRSQRASTHSRRAVVPVEHSVTQH